MKKHKIKKQDLAKLLSEWSSKFTILTPSQTEGATGWTKWEGTDTTSLDWYRNTTVPPKNIFLPLMEALFSFHRDKEGYHLEAPPSDTSKQLVFGIRPCDARSLALLDKTFYDTYKDPYYIAKREGTVLVGLTCTNPYDSCFCTSLSSSPHDSSHVDLLLTDIGDEFLIEAITDKGSELLTNTSLTKTAVKADETKAEASKKAADGKVTRKINVEGIQDKLLTCFDNKDYWDKVSLKCISCGICTLLCPTCYCFDINDEFIKDQGERFRSWDSCAFPLYTKMPMENPRLEKWRRLRQKICHKYAFYPMNFNEIACTGCGRCIRLCPVNWDITLALSNLPANKKREQEK